MQCTNNMKQLGLALHLYSDQWHRLPPGYGVGYPTGTGVSGGGQWAWLMRLFPYIEQSAMDQAINWGKYAGDGYTQQEMAMFTTKYSAFQCPSDVTVKTNWYAAGSWMPAAGLSRASYAGNFGLGDPKVTDSAKHAVSAQLEGAGHINGVFIRNNSLRLEDIHDGTSHTVMTGELIPGDVCCLRGVWIYVEGPVFMTEYTPNDPTADLTRPGRCGGADKLPGAIAPCTPSVSNWTQILNTARSCHSGGVNVGMCDGSVFFASNYIAIDVWHAIGSPSGGENVSEKW
jgi:prepilin-type processing-associated H-X9-DG protein